jgi:hypothetical protein
MQAMYHLSESELMEAARRLLENNRAPRKAKIDIAYSMESEARRARSLRACHFYSLYEGRRYPRPKESGAYVPAMSARLDNDLNLTEGARRCARKLMEEGYRKARSTRALPVTVSYLARALGRCRRTIQRYLRLLEREGYIEVLVVAAERSRMCWGLVVRLLEPLFAWFQKKKWPSSRRNPDATGESQNDRHLHHLKRSERRFSCEAWARRCMDGVFRALMKTNPFADLPDVLTG